MSTRSRIGIEDESGQIVHVYCHSDGYPEGVGAVLLAHYRDAERVKGLIDLADLSFVEGSLEDLCPVGTRDGAVCSYNRWRDEGTTTARSVDRDEYLNAADDTGAEYVYLYGSRGWEIACNVPEGPFHPLVLLLGEG